MTSITILWIYIVLLVAGGIMGFVKAKSKISLIMADAFAILLALCALGFLPFKAALVLLGLLVVVFAIRLAKTKKFMPSGLMVVLSALTLVLLLVMH